MLQPTACLASGTDPATVQPAMQLRGAWSMLTRWSVMLARVLEDVEARRRVRKEHAHTLHEGAICQFMVLRGPSPWRRLKPRPGRSVILSRRLAELWLLGYMPYRLKSSQSASPPIREGKVLGSSTRAPTASGVDLPAVPDSSLRPEHVHLSAPREDRPDGLASRYLRNLGGVVSSMRQKARG